MKSFFVGLMLAAIVAASTLSNVFAAEVSGMARGAALQKCNAEAERFLLYVWGNVQLFVYRECMYAHGQNE